MNHLPIGVSRLYALNKAAQLDLQQELRTCGCIGPQNGEPLCPCQMRGVQIKDGRYVRIQDLGPAPKGVA